MKTEIKTIDSRKKSNFLYAYGFGIYSDNHEMQELFSSISSKGVKSFVIEDDDIDDSRARLRINDKIICCIEDEDLNFILDNRELIALAYVCAERVPREDEHYNKEGLRKISESRNMFLHIEVYYFNEVLSQEKREKIIKKELRESENGHEDSNDGQRFRSRDVRMIRILNIILVIACICLTIYCYVKGMKGYGLFMVAFALFFAVWGRKFSRAKKK